ncbi:TRAP transporter large permease [Paracoccaceae bacterium]|jgi:C4-dicarboxylate transporter DctM subunit|nr:TRAP transporter large permease [Paracoccaceae bacterium]
MSDVHLLLMILFPMLLVVGVPIYVALGLTGFAATYFTGSPLQVSSQSILNGIDKFPLLAIPAFIFAGNLMEQGGITQSIVRVFRHMLGHIPGSLGIVTIFSCMFFAAISGSGPGAAAAVGAIMIPAMVRYGYPPAYAAAAAATGGTLGVMIPPSNPMILYGIIANTSIRDLFIAGVVPGILVGFALAGVAYLYAKWLGIKAIDREERDGSLLRVLWDGKAALAMPILILGGIYSGIFTPVEASVVAVLYAAFVGVFVNRTLTREGFSMALHRTHIISGALMIVVAASTLFARIITLERIPQMLVETFSNATDNTILVLLMINILLLIVGCFMETLSAIIILGPVLVPLIVLLGVDKTHFGIILILNIEIAFLTPPLGVNLFVASQIAGIKIEKMMLATLPYILILMVMLALITLVPEISLWLPRTLK